MRPLIIDDAAKAKATSVLKYAAAHPYRPQSDPAPGYDPNFRAEFNTYSAVFSFTHIDGDVFRHLTVSVPGPKFPNPAAVFTIAGLFGFTGWDERTINRVPDGWLMDVSDREGCVVLAQICGQEHAEAENALH